ncbi:Trimethylguanosine synthase [Zancudomyces culisetae]|uniref:Trimethylguanosine synthase n=1 Tax=Zancudomyces culisetae TaxID=1213189 RepID=A0A1R1PDX3_ZANCU|nr:Trimethylguanosine synthase [Zancudomyces culisetae]|eukprot:OMH79195.1 Trimethylguanosine synthase [Zancudomyces culisetae]
MIRALLLQLIGENCTIVLYDQLDIFNRPCIVHFLLKGLGLGLVLGGCIVKVPQIHKIVAAQSGYGISQTAVVLDAVSNVIVYMYNRLQNNPFTTYGEALFIFIQNMVILYLIGYYGSGKHAVSVFSNSSSGVGGGVARGNFASDDGYFLLPIFSSSSTKNNKLKFKQMNAPAGASSRAEYSVKGSSASFGGVFGRISRLLQSPVLAPIALYTGPYVTNIGSGGSTVEPGTRVEAGMNANANANANANINIGQGTGGDVSVDMDTGAISDSSKESSGLALVLFGFMYKFLAIPIMITSKTLQIHSNYVLKTTGQGQPNRGISLFLSHETPEDQTDSTELHQLPVLGTKRKQDSESTVASTHKEATDLSSGTLATNSGLQGETGVADPATVNYMDTLVSTPGQREHVDSLTPTPGSSRRKRKKLRRLSGIPNQDNTKNDGLNTPTKEGQATQELSGTSDSVNATTDAIGDAVLEDTNAIADGDVHASDDALLQHEKDSNLVEDQVEGDGYEDQNEDISMDDTVYNQLYETYHAEKAKDLDPSLRKYWRQRYTLFSKYDDGILLDPQSWYSVTPECIAQHIAEKASGCASQDQGLDKMGCQEREQIAIDAFCGAGGNTIQFAKYFKRVVAIDIDPLKIQMAKYNAQIYDVHEKIDFICGDFVSLLSEFASNTNKSGGGGGGGGVLRKLINDFGDNTGCTGKEQEIVVFMSPPWGGIDYQETCSYTLETVDLPPPPSPSPSSSSPSLSLLSSLGTYVAGSSRDYSVDGKELFDLVENSFEKVKIIYFLPRNSDTAQVGFPSFLLTLIIYSFMFLFPPPCGINTNINR